ncbi:MAG: ATP phosphoribosyltransferase [Pseudobdellovibrionaceae bacterium]
MSASENNLQTPTRIKIALQKNGRLTESTLALLQRCGLDFQWAKDRLLCQCSNFPLDLIFVRDDDIPEHILRGTCDLGFVGENVVLEKVKPSRQSEIITHERLDYGKCRLSICWPKEEAFLGLSTLQNKKIATSYPEILEDFLQKNNVQSEVVLLNGSIEIAPSLGLVDGICDLVATGSTLKSHGLKEVHTVLFSECILIGKKPTDTQKILYIQDFLLRLRSTRKAQTMKYVMMNAPREALPQIRSLIPGLEHPSIVALDNNPDKIAIHAVCNEDSLWAKMDDLKKLGASSILVLPIEKII